MDTLRRFEGTSLDELLAFVHRECGESAQIIEANRVRRGGVGGFFAKEGFEVVVSPGGTDDGAAQDDDQPLGGPVDDVAGGRPWMRSTASDTNPSSRAAAMARAMDDEDGDELIGEVANTLNGVHNVAAGAGDLDEQAVAREAIQRLRADRAALVPPPLRTPVAPIKADLQRSGDPLMGLVDETNDHDQREPVTFAAALEQAMAEPPSTPRTMTLDDLLELELPTETIAAPAPPFADRVEQGADNGPAIADQPGLADEPANAPLTMLAEDFIRQADARYREGVTEPGAFDPQAAAMAEQLIAQASAVEPVITPVIEPVAADAPIAVPEPVARPEAVAAPSVVELIARFGQVPTAPPLPAGPGVVLVVGEAALAYATAGRLAGEGNPVALASPEPPATVPSWSAIRTTDDVLDRVERAQRQGERLVLGVELAAGPAGLLWAKRLIDRLAAVQVRMAVSTAASPADVRAAIELLGRIDALDLSRADDPRNLDSPTTPLDVEQVLGLGTPIATVDGHPTSPALWAALTLEGATHG